MPRALIALAAGAFAIGTTEFLMGGLLPQVASDLGVSIPTAGYLVSAYALGVVVGAPTLIAASVRRPRKHVLVGLMVLFVLGHVAVALAPDYAALLVARFATGLAHGAFFGAGAVVARSVVPPERAAQALSLMFFGITLANVVGVPAATALGQVVSWRTAFAGVAGLGVVTIAAILVWVPLDEGAPTDLRRELAAFRRPQVLLALAVMAIGTGALFAVYSYVVPVLTHLSGFSPSAVVWVLVVYGVGTSCGTLLGGHVGDRRPLGAIIGAMVALAVVLAVFLVTSGSKVGAVITLTAFGLVAFSFGPPLQKRVMDAAAGAAVLVSAAGQAAFNLANALGAALGARVLDAGYGYRATMVVGIVLALVGMVIALLAWWLERSGRAPLEPARHRPPGAGGGAGVDGRRGGGQDAVAVRS